jgi:general secretion pathway protein G
MYKKKLKAFTLIEILVALTIIGVLLTFVAPYVLNRPDQARELKLKNDFMAISTALNLYKLDNGTLPEPAKGLDVLTGDSSNKYLQSVPLDPWGVAYKLEKAKDSSGIILRSAGPDRIFGNTSDDDDLLSDIIK